MGHYDDVIEEREWKEFQAIAKRLGITPQKLIERNRHEEKMCLGQKLFLERQKEDELIKYYLQFKETLDGNAET